ncbi:25915_t:CDS:2, partial [Dentiscutata erythropus]
ITPEKFIESLKFRKFLNNVSQTCGVQFIIDESHCVLEFEYFRPAWTKLGQIKNEFSLSPILLLTATCSYEGASKLAIILKRPNLKEIRSSQIYQPHTNEIQLVQYNYLERMKKKIFAIAYTFEDSYQCHQKMAYEPFRWPKDPEISKCDICDNCKRYIDNKIIWCDISEDLLQILDTVDKLVNFTNDLTTPLVNFGHDDIVDIFTRAKNKNAKEKNLTSLWENDSDK